MAEFSCSWNTYEDYAILTANFTGGTSGFIGTRYVRCSIDGGSYKQFSARSSGGDFSISCTVTGLSPGTNYTWYVELGYKSDGDSSITWCAQYGYDDSGTFETEAEEISVGYWSWTMSNGSASAAQTRAAYTVVTNNGMTSEFSYKVWNDMCAKVREVRVAKGVGAWDTVLYGVSYNDALMSSGDILTAARFNALRYNIGSHYGTGISEVNPGDIVYGWYFTRLMSRLNEWIDAT